MIKNIVRVKLAVAAALAIMVSACSIANFGWLRNSQDVGQAFETWMGGDGNDSGGRD